MRDKANTDEFINRIFEVLAIITAYFCAVLIFRQFGTLPRDIEGFVTAVCMYSILLFVIDRIRSFSVKKRIASVFACALTVSVVFLTVYLLLEKLT